MPSRSGSATRAATHLGRRHPRHHVLASRPRTRPSPSTRRTPTTTNVAVPRRRGQHLRAAQARQRDLHPARNGAARDHASCAARPTVSASRPTGSTSAPTSTASSSTPPPTSPLRHAAPSASAPAAASATRWDDLARHLRRRARSSTPTTSIRRARLHLRHGHRRPARRSAPARTASTVSSRTDWAFLRGRVRHAPASRSPGPRSSRPRRRPSRAASTSTSSGSTASSSASGPTQSIGSETRYDGFDVTGLLEPGAETRSGVARLDHRATSASRPSSWSSTPTAPGDVSVPARQWTVAVTAIDVFPSAGSIGTELLHRTEGEPPGAPRSRIGFDEPGLRRRGLASRRRPKAAFADLVADPDGEGRAAAPGSRSGRGEGARPLLHRLRPHLGRRLCARPRRGTAGQVLDMRFGEELVRARTPCATRLRTGNTYQDRWTLARGAAAPGDVGHAGVPLRRGRSARPTGLDRRRLPGARARLPVRRRRRGLHLLRPDLDQVWQLSQQHHRGDRTTTSTSTRGRASATPTRPTPTCS